MAKRTGLTACASGFLLLVVIGGYFLLTREAGVETENVHKVGVLCGLDYIADIVDGFKAGMTDLGYVEGKNVVYDLQRVNFDLAEYRRILKKFVDDKVDLIFVCPTEASMEAKVITQGTNIPVVFTFANIEDTGLVASVREPGGNVTGVRYPGPDIAVRRLEIMCELAPQAKRILVPYQYDYPIVASQMEALRKAVAGTGVTLVEAPVNGAAGLEADLQARATSDDTGVDAVLVLAGPLAVMPDTFAMMGKFAAEHKIPLGGALNAGGGYESVFGVNANILECGKQAAPLADRILKGTPAGTVPVVSAESYFELNYRAALELGLTVSEGMVSRADKVVR